VPDARLEPAGLDVIRDTREQLVDLVAIDPAEDLEAVEEGVVLGIALATVGRRDEERARDRSLEERRVREPLGELVARPPSALFVAGHGRLYR